MADRGKAERRVGGGDAEVAAECDLEPSTEARPLDRRDRRRGDRLDLRERDVPPAKPIAAEPVSGERREIDPGAERAALATDDDRARAAVAEGIRGGAGEVVDRVAVGRIQFLRPRKDQPADAVRAGGHVLRVRCSLRGGHLDAPSTPPGGAHD